VGTLCPVAAAPPPLDVLVVPVLLELVPPQAVAIEAAMSMRAIRSVREEVRADLVFIGPPES
jgi:hypothetical protein